MKNYWLQKENGLTVLFLLIAALFATPSQAQVAKGKIIDARTREAIPYVHIGIMDKNRGVISHDKGQFQLDISGLKADEKVLFSILGYETKQLLVSELQEKELVISLQAKTYALQEVVVKPPKIISSKKMGRYQTTKTTTGQSGIKDFGFGGEWGLKVKYEGQRYQLANVNFHTRFNTVDSVLYRIHLYEVENGLPGKQLLQKEIYTTSHRKDKWISADLSDQELLISSDIIVTFEVIRIWFRKKGDNQLFYTHGKNYPEGQSFSRASSFGQWNVDERGPIALYITAKILE
ncbi:MAG: carboxypeptidase-like regulatory domain-containing protein [Bacteroidota bacterium]